MGTAILVSGADASAWQKAALLLVFAYGGFEPALTPLSEAKNPRRDAAVCALHRPDHVHGLYTAIQWVVTPGFAGPWT